MTPCNFFHTLLWAWDFFCLNYIYKATRKIILCFCCSLFQVRPYFDWTTKIAVYFGMYEFSLHFQRREAQILFVKGKFIFQCLDNLICESVNLPWKMTFQNFGCVFAYFCGRQNNFQLQFCSSFSIFF